MCVAVLRILFKGNDRQLVAVETEDDLNAKVESLKDNEQVIEFTVFGRTRKLVRRTSWEEQP